MLLTLDNSTVFRVCKSSHVMMQRGFLNICAFNRSVTSEVTRLFTAAETCIMFRSTGSIFIINNLVVVSGIRNSFSDRVMHSANASIGEQRTRLNGKDVNTSIIVNSVSLSFSRSIIWCLVETQVQRGGRHRSG